MIRHPVIGVSGKKRSGKDTYAEVLVEEFGYTRVAFADPMKAAALALDPIVDMEPYGPNVLSVTRLSDAVDDLGWEGSKDEYEEARRTLQRLGTEMGRNLFGESFWVDQALKTVEAVDGPVVITDVRFPNEARAVERLPLGWTVRIERPGLPAGDRHGSETALDDYLFEDIVQNDGTIEELHEHARNMARLVRVWIGQAA